MGETSYFNNLLRQYEASGNVVGAQRTSPYAAAAGGNPTASALPRGGRADQATPLQPSQALPRGNMANQASGVKREVDLENPPVTPSHITDATSIYNQMIQEGNTQAVMNKALAGPQVSVGAPPPQVFQSGQETWSGDVGDGRGQWGTGGPTQQDPYAPATPAPVGPQGPAPGAPDTSGIVYDLPDYKPPKEDKMAGKKQEQIAYQRGRGDLMQQTHNAIISAKSLDNPMARGQFVGEILRGMGAGLSQLSAQAGKEGTRYALNKRSEQLKIYDAQFQAESAEAAAAYDAEMNQAMNQWQSEFAEWQQGGSGGKARRQKVGRSVSAASQSGGKTRGM